MDPYEEIEPHLDEDAPGFVE
ncbi:hypothetical protein MNBD_ACTINO01-612, partial [hydrothermal vent metagenome]